MSDVGATILGVSAIFCVGLAAYFGVLRQWLESRSKLSTEANEAALLGREMLVRISHEPGEAMRAEASSQERAAGTTSLAEVLVVLQETRRGIREEASRAAREAAEEAVKQIREQEKRR